MGVAISVRPADQALLLRCTVHGNELAVYGDSVVTPETTAFYEEHQDCDERQQPALTSERPRSGQVDSLRRSTSY